MELLEEAYVAKVRGFCSTPPAHFASYPVQVGNPILQTRRFCVGTHTLETVKGARANGADIRVPRKPTTMALDVLS